MLLYASVISSLSQSLSPFPSLSHLLHSLVLSVVPFVKTPSPSALSMNVFRMPFLNEPVNLIACENLCFGTQPFS